MSVRPKSQDGVAFKMSEDSETDEGGLTPKRAYELKERGYSYREISSLYDKQPSHTTVRRWVMDYKKGLEEGRGSVDPTDFDTEDLRDALDDKETENPYTAPCPACGDDIEQGTTQCPHCNAGPIRWQ